MSSTERPTVTLTWEEARMILGALDTATQIIGGDPIEPSSALSAELEAFEALAVLTERMYG